MVTWRLGGEEGEEGYGEEKREEERFEEKG